MDKRILAAAAAVDAEDGVSNGTSSGPGGESQKHQAWGARPHLPFPRSPMRALHTSHRHIGGSRRFAAPRSGRAATSGASPRRSKAAHRAAGEGGGASLEGGKEEEKMSAEPMGRLALLFEAGRRFSGLPVPQLPPSAPLGPRGRGGRKKQREASQAKQLVASKSKAGVSAGSFDVVLSVFEVLYDIPIDSEDGVGEDFLTGLLAIRIIARESCVSEAEGSTS